MRIERVDDLPVLGQQILEGGLPGYLDEFFPDHGHWKGASGGIVASGWLLYILSEADHRLSVVEDWAADRLWCLRGILGSASLRSLDFNDDRLGNLLDRYADDDRWDRFESSFNSQVIKAFDVTQLTEGDPRSIRLDSMNVPSFREAGALFKFGYNKQKRSDMPHIKAMVATLDPMALPLGVELVDGRTSDDGTYLPLVKKLRGSIPKGNTLFIGDSKMGSRGNRSALFADGDYYLCPLNRKQCTPSQLYEYLEKKPAQLERIYDDPADHRGEAYLFEVSHPMHDESGELSWQERRVLVYSTAYGDKHKRSLSQRLQAAEEKLGNLVIPKIGRPYPKSMVDLQAKARTIIKKYDLKHLLTLEFGEEIHEKPLQRYKDRPARIKRTSKYSLTVTRNEQAIEKELSRLGWQVYASNISVEQLGSADLVKYYRNEYRIEQLFHYLANRVTNLLPVYLKKEERVKGLIRLLLLALKFSTLFQHRIRTTLAESNQELANLYPGNAERRTKRPTTRMLLRAFQNISMVIMDNGKKSFIQMTDLTPAQKKILSLIRCPNPYDRLTEFLNTHYFLRET